MLPRYVEEVSHDSLYYVKVGYVVEREARNRHISLEELAVKARRGSFYLQRIGQGVAPFVQLHDIMRICETLDISMPDFFQLVEQVSPAEVRLARRHCHRIIWAGGTSNSRNIPPPEPTEPPPTPTPSRRKTKKLSVVKEP